MMDDEDLSSLGDLGGGGSCRGGGKPPPRITTEEARQKHGDGVLFICGGSIHGYRVVPHGKNSKPKKCLMCGLFSYDPSPLDSAVCLRVSEWVS